MTCADLDRLVLAVVGDVPDLEDRLRWFELEGLWLNAGVPAPEVAARAGNSVEVLLKVHAKSIDGDEEIVNRRIEAALSGERR